ncbi:hypothetical protein ACFSTH_11685 [Paenibacillus yanchengensis]|uniref:Uncharacterized protein n=1 Tax=Paenibacillus yanchengensis TaxID=2035833 RepID=A0ABW4YR41_9BACL
MKHREDYEHQILSILAKGYKKRYLSKNEPTKKTTKKKLITGEEKKR